MIVSPASHKPLYLFHLLHTLSLSSALCFTKSVDAASRLAKLVELFEEERALSADSHSSESGEKKVVVKSYSSELPASERTKILASFKKGEIQMYVSSSPPFSRSASLINKMNRRLICSDLISRGIDLPFVSHVISYDIPTDMRKYVHRVGRTARAGKKGDAWSLVEDQEVRFSFHYFRFVSFRFLEEAEVDLGAFALFLGGSVQGDYDGSAAFQEY